MRHSPASVFGRFLKTAALGFTLGIGFWGTAAAQEVFEGRVKMRMAGEGEQQTLDYYVKGERMRVEMNGPQAQGGVMILHMKEKKMLILMPDQKMYMTMPLPDIKQDASENKKPEPTGKTKTILGYEAEQYLIDEGGSEFEVWATDELGAFAGLHLPGDDPQGGPSPAESALSGQKFFPLLIIERRGGREATRVEVTEVERKKLEDELFEPPADFQGMELPLQAPR